MMQDHIDQQFGSWSLINSLIQKETHLVWSWIWEPCPWPQHPPPLSPSSPPSASEKKNSFEQNPSNASTWAQHCIELKTKTMIGCPCQGRRNSALRHKWALVGQVTLGIPTLSDHYSTSWPVPGVPPSHPIRGTRSYILHPTTRPHKSSGALFEHDSTIQLVCAASSVSKAQIPTPASILFDTLPSDQRLQSRLI